tara:strand:- start:491 stop:991 length:501 start_codon:yes stop_codon:yes gene_type:complete
MPEPLIIKASESNRFDLTDYTIYLDFLVPDDKKNPYKHVGCYYLDKKDGAKGIIVHISNGTTELICGKEDLISLPIEIPFSTIKFDSEEDKPFNLDKDDSVNVYIVNDIPKDFNTNIFRTKYSLLKMFHKDSHDWGCGKFKISDKMIEGILMPDEAGGGGVIVRNP